MKKGKNKGITLIALIITIIVMLILVGVTVSVALNGGLFKTAQDAAKGTDKARIEEEMTSVVTGFMNENLLADANIEQLKQEIANIKGVTSVEGNTFPLTVKDENGNEWTINQDGMIETKEPEVEKEISADDPEASYWKTNGSGTIIDYDLPEGVEIPETLIVPCKIGDEKITAIADYALVGVKVDRSEDGTKILDVYGYPIPLDVMDESGNLIPTGTTSKVKKVVISKGILTIGSAGFSYCTSLTNITLPEGLVTIGDNAFNMCTSIEEIIIPSTVDNIGQFAFNNWDDTQTIYIKGKTEVPPDSDNDSYNNIGWSMNWDDGCNANKIWDK